MVTFPRDHGIKKGDRVRGKTRNGEKFYFVVRTIYEDTDHTELWGVQGGRTYINHTEEAMPTGADAVEISVVSERVIEPVVRKYSATNEYVHDPAGLFFARAVNSDMALKIADAMNEEEGLS